MIKKFKDFQINESIKISSKEFINKIRMPFDDVYQFLFKIKEFDVYKSKYWDYEVDVYEIPYTIFNKVTGWDINDIELIGKEFKDWDDGNFYLNKDRNTVNLQMAT